MNTQEHSRFLALGLRVAELAREANVTPATIRHYARTGLLHAGRDNGNGYRLFSYGDVRRTIFIRQAQALGLTLDDIKTILDEVDHGNLPCHRVKSLVTERLQAIRTRIAELRETESRIDEALNAWQKTGDWQPGESDLCPLIERLAPLQRECSVA